MGKAGAVGTCSLRAEAIVSAQRLFLQWGYSGTSIAMIAGGLGVTKAALYYHFPDKEALFLAVFDDYLRGIAEDLAGLTPLFEPSSSSALVAFEALASVFLSRGAASARMDALAFQEAPALGAAGRSALGQKYHRDLVQPLGERFALAEKAGWIRATREGEPARVWLFMGLLSAFFAPGHESAKGTERAKRDDEDIEGKAAAFARLLLEGIGAH